MVIIDPRQRIDINNPDVISRHALYAKALSGSDEFHTRRLVVIQPSSSKKSSMIQPASNLLVIRVSNFYTKLLWDRKFAQKISLRYSLNPALLISGDPDISYIAAKMFEKLNSESHLKQLPFYVQVHSELNWKLGTSDLVQFLKFCVARFALKNATRIRSTSNEHRSQISKSFNIPSQKIDAIPLPLPENSFRNINFKFPRPETIAFVGRLHKERNPESFLIIAAGYCAKNPLARILIIGDGPEKARLEGISRKLPCANQINFLGELDSKALGKAWKEIGVLISTASYESYGRSMREALLNGVPVLAMNSLGSRSLAEEAPLKWVELIENISDPETLHRQIKQLLELRLDESYRISQMRRQQNIPNQLVESWLRSLSAGA